MADCRVCRRDPRIVPKDSWCRWCSEVAEEPVAEVLPEAVPIEDLTSYGNQETLKTVHPHLKTVRPGLENRTPSLENRTSLENCTPSLENRTHGGPRAGAGRPRKWASEAERLKAYRARQKEAVSAR